MVAFWSLFLVAAYGVLGSLPVEIKKWMQAGLPEGEEVPIWIREMPVLGDFGMPMVIALGVQAVIAFLLHKWLSRPKTADYLIETEQEMRKVVWPSWKETRSGSFAVMVTVLVMLVFLLAVDAFLVEAFQRIFIGLRMGS